ncbi:MAG TPA: STAS domain-containing protein [Marmoricola sp.]|jgi:anti-anti-sigma factor|nr:STAS domain-containing protein [Marmoricola sp.]
MEAAHAIESYPLGDAMVVIPSGELDIASAPMLRDELAAVITAEPRPRVVCCDLTDVTFMDSTALSALVFAHETAAMGGQEFCVAGARASVHRVIELTQLDQVIACHGSMDAARQVILGGAPDTRDIS